MAFICKCDKCNTIAEVGNEIFCEACFSDLEDVIRQLKKQLKMLKKKYNATLR